MSDPSTESHPPSRWPAPARAAIALTLDNMGEAADLNRSLWPSSAAIGAHRSVVTVLPRLLALLSEYSVPATYFIEAWNLNVYPESIRRIDAAGHEIAWHAWQHEAWGKLNADEERENFERSFGATGWRAFRGGGDKPSIDGYRGFRPPGGLVHGWRTFELCRRFGVAYISPAADEAAMVKASGLDEGLTDEKQDGLVVLPFKWATVDAYFYMEAFAGLRKAKGEFDSECQAPSVLVERYKQEIDRAVEGGGFLSLLFHPFLTDRPERLKACEEVLRYLAEKRDQGLIWLARCKDVEYWIRDHPGIVGDNPGWDTTSWR
ncbi:MAG: hypothetical protein MMC23_003990 [Stictis urceolatum]|nr:hypothetical protein [Stictis urceolata]